MLEEYVPYRVVRLERQETKAVTSRSRIPGRSVKEERDHQEIVSTVSSHPNLFSEEEKQELYLLLEGVHGATRKHVLQVAPQRQQKWWKEMYLSEYRERRFIGEWAVRFYGAMLRDVKA
jgi:hypothetical protein